MATRRSTEIPPSIAASAEPAARKAQPPQQKARAKAPPRPAAVSAADRHEMIAERAYLRAEERGFAPGHEVADWVAAEQEVDALLGLLHGGAAQ